MKKSGNASLAQVRDAIRAYNDSDRNWKRFSWIYSQLSRTARFLALFAQSSDWWKSRNILPLLCNAAHPHLERYQSGNWTYEEEKTLKIIFLFFVHLNKTISLPFPDEMIDFFHKPAPSFSQEKSHTLSSNKENLHLQASCQWQKNERFTEYQARLHKLTEQPIPSVQEEEKLIQPQTKKRIIALFTRISQIQKQYRTLVEQIETTIKETVCLIEECPEIPDNINALRNETISTISSIEHSMNQLSHTLSLGTNKEAQHIIKKISNKQKAWEQTVQLLSTTISTIQSTAKSAEEMIHTKLRQLTRMINKTPVLHPKNLLAKQQATLLHKSRDFLKEFRSTFSKGYQPAIPFSTLKEKINVWTEVAAALHHEGIEIETMHKDLTHLENQIHEQLETNRSHPDLNDLLITIKSFKEELLSHSHRKLSFEELFQKYEMIKPSCT